MNCLRCGYCCTKLLTVIPIDPELEDPITHENLRGINLLEERCPYLKGDKPGEYGCSIHDKPWFKEMGCGQYQEHWPGQDCRMGAYLVKEGGRGI